VGSVLLIFLVSCIVLRCVFTLLYLLLCPVSCVPNFLTLSLCCPYFTALCCKRFWVVHSWFPYVAGGSKLSILDFPMLLVALSCSFVISLSVFFNVYLQLIIINDFYTLSIFLQQYFSTCMPTNQKWEKHEHNFANYYVGGIFSIFGMLK
jgi:hypothetical protein